MNDGVSRFLQNVAKESEGRFKVLERILSSADSSKVFGQPVTTGEYTVITASEVTSGGGFGSGIGFGVPPEQDGGSPKKADEARNKAGEGGGGGGGGGGGSIGRPVAAIVMGPEGVKVVPVVDVTKISLAWFTVLGAMGAVGLKMISKR